MQKHSKTENALRNAVIGITNNVVVLVLHLLSRKLFLRYLGIEYLSVEQVARSLLSILSFSEMPCSICSISRWRKVTGRKSPRLSIPSAG